MHARMAGHAGRALGECYRRTATRTTKSLDTGLSISVLRRALDGVDDEYIDGAALRVELQSELFLQCRID